MASDLQKFILSLTEPALLLSGELILEANTAAEELFVAQPGALRKLDFRDLLPPAVKVGYGSAWKRWRQEAHVPGLLQQVSARTPAGRQLRLEISISPFVTDRGTLHLLILRDITRREREIQTLRRDLARFQRLTLVIPDPALIHDLEGQILYANQAFFRLSGYTTRDLPHLRLPDLFSTASRKEVETQLSERRSGIRETQQCEMVLESGDGEHFDLEVSTTVISPPGAAVEVLLVGKEISQEKRWKQEYHRLQRILEAVPEAFCVCDRNGIMELATAGLQQLCGTEMLEGASIFMLTTTIGALHLENKILPDLFASGHWSGELPLLHKNGRQLLCEAHFRLLKEKNGTTRILGGFRDATQRRELERQLITAQKMEALGRLTGGVAHDFNNLLTVMSGYSEMLLQSAKEHKQKVGLEEIKKAAARAAGLTRRLLSFSRRELRNDLAVNLNGVLQEMRLMLERLLGENVRLITRCADDLWPVDLEEGQVEQVIANLVVNARDAMPRGGTITLTTENRSLDPDFCRERPPLQPGAHVVVTVSDTGEGIPAALLPEIFNPFFTTKEEGKGTGLGLATVSSIIQRAGGYIEVESSPGKGTTFRIHLPRSTAQTADKVQLLENPPLPRGRENILLVEDDNGLRRLTREILEEQGYRVFPAACGLEALKLFRRAREIDLVLSDVMLPNLGGRELAEKLRRQDPRLPILLMSGYGPPPRLEDQQGKPFPCLQKPFPPLTLARKVRELLDGKN